jgi:hypothetical protein
VSAPAEQGVYREMTVASVREPQGQATVKVAFLEAARFYTLPRELPGFPRILEQLREAQVTRRALKIRLATLDSDVIEDVAP